MKRKLFVWSFVFSFFVVVSKEIIEAPQNPYATSFKKAYMIYPSVPKGFLEAIAYTQTRFYHLNGNQNSCVGLPKSYTIMGLIEDGKNYFRNNLFKVASLSNFSLEDIKNSPETSIMAYASAFQNLQQQNHLFGIDNLEKYIPIFIELSELPNNQNLIDNYALNAHLYQIYWFLNQPEFQEAYEFQNYQLNLKEIFKSNYNVLSAKHVIVTDESIYSNMGAMYKNTPLHTTSADYPPAIWNPAATCNYSSRGGTAISAVTIHDTEGSYAGAISWFQNCAASVSAHYVLRSSDGQVTQMVLEANKAWHVGTENPYTIGLEHEGYLSTGYTWYTTAMYNSSAALVRDICTSGYGISPVRTGFWPWLATTQYNTANIPGACTKIKGHQHYPNQTHNDPGQYWNWDRYFKLVNNTYTVATYTATTGNFYDSGGPTGNYSNDERKVYMFTKSGATNITISFSSFDTENTWDYMYIYDGGTVWSPLIGTYTGANTPGTITSVNDTLLVEFRSDCATTATGWAATYTINSSTPTSTDVVAPTTSITSAAPWITANFTTTITDADNVGGSGVQKGYYQVIDFNGTEWRANQTHGFFADNFDLTTIHSDWTIKKGTWSETGGALVQSDESSVDAGNTNIYAAITQTLSNRYLYEFDIQLNGTGVNRRGGFHFFCDNADSTNRNNSYFVWFRLDDQKFQLYKVINNVFTTPVVDIPLTFSAGTWYNVKVIFDRTTGTIWTYWNNILINKYIDSSPHTVGKYVSFRSGNAVMNINQLKIYRSRISGNIPISVGSGNTNDLRYQNPSPSQPAGKIKSISQDNADNISVIAYQDINVDWTPPSNPSPVNDGKAADINIACTKDSLSANWTFSNDPNSGINYYWYSIGTSAGATNILNWTSNWASNIITVNIPVISNGTTYFFNVKSENGAGLQSAVVSSNGQTVDTSCVAADVTVLSNYLRQPIVFPNPIKNYCEVFYSFNYDIEIFDISGKLVFQNKNTTNKIRIATDTWSTGVYFIKIYSADKIFTDKLIKE